MPRAKIWYPAKSIPAKVRKELLARGVNVERVRDARTTLSLNVLAEDVKKGTRKDPLGCAGALCAVRQEKVDAAVIRVKIAYLVKGSDAVRYNVPPSVRQQLVLFDRAGMFEPGMYVLHPPTPTQRLGDSRVRPTGPKRRRRRDSTTVLRNVTAGMRW